MNEPEPARQYHQLTEHHPGFPPRTDGRLVAAFEPMRPGRKPPQFKRYAGVDVVPLPADPPESTVDAVDVLSGAAPSAGAALEVGALANLLFHAAGVVRFVDLPGAGRMYFRAAGSAGNLGPLEVYVVAGGIGGLDDGVYHYDPVAHGLDRLSPSPVAGGATAVVLTGVPWRTAWKYAERGFRHLYWDAGTMLANLLAVADAGGLIARVRLGFVDADVNRVLGVDGVHEFALAVVALGPADWPDVLSAVPGVPAGFLADEPLEFPLVTEVQRAGDLPTPAGVEQWRARATGAAAGPAEETPAPPPGGRMHVVPPVAPGSIERVIRRRGSTRAFASSETAPGDVLWWAMSASTRPVPADFVGAGATLLEHQLGVHAVEGVEPGVYRWAPEGLEQRATGDVRSACARLCLGQDLGGSGAYTVFHAADLDTVLNRLGARGYRAVHLEAGIVEGRLHLAAFARGVGATGLTVFDDEVRRFFRVSVSPVLVTAVGRPAYRARPGGRPRRPTAIGR